MFIIIMFLFLLEITNKQQIAKDVQKMMVYNENNSNASNDYGMTPFVVAKIEKKSQNQFGLNPRVRRMGRY